MNIRQDFLPTSASNRPGNRINPTYITVHETANTNRGANAEMHTRYIKGADARKRQVSWHYTTDDKEIIQHLPDNERGWHAGSGNGSSIGIELCVNSDGDFQQTKRNAAALIQILMKKHNIPLSRVVTHKHWTGKNCPARLLNEWESFKGLITGATPPSQPQTGGTQVAGSYTVKRGDTLTSIAREHKTSVQALVQANKGINPDVLQVGQKLNLSGSQSAPSKPAPQPAKKKYTLPTGVLRRGSKGNAVSQLQTALNAANFKVGTVDGDYGPRTQDAVRRLQSVHLPREVDGVYGPNTRRALDGLVNK